MIMVTKLSYFMCYYNFAIGLNTLNEKVGLQTSAYENVGCPKMAGKIFFFHYYIKITGIFLICFFLLNRFFSI